MKSINDYSLGVPGVQKIPDSPSSEETMSVPYPVQPSISRPTLDRFLVFASLLIMACTSSLASVLVLKKQREQDDHVAAQKGEAAGSEKREWYADWPTDIQTLSKNSTKLISEQRSVVIFENGTCVVINEPVKDRQETALNVLRITADPEAKFEIKYLPNSNYIVTFSPTVFAWIEARHIAEHKNTILKNTDEGLSERERNELNGRNLPLETRIGVLARSLLIDDSNTSRVVKIIRAKPSESTGALTQIPTISSAE